MAFHFCLEGGVVPYDKAGVEHLDAYMKKTMTTFPKQEWDNGETMNGDQMWNELHEGPEKQELSEVAAQRLWNALKEPQLNWAVWWKPWRRCKAVKEPNASGLWGRCELDRDHNYAIEPEQRDHALERGFDEPRWSTRWTGGGEYEAQINDIEVASFQRGYEAGWDAAERHWNT